MGPRGVIAAAQEGAQAPYRPTAVQASEPLTRERFPRRVRLARSAELRACWEQGRRWRTPHLELASRPNAVGHLRVAFVVPRFQFTAVARNQLRRRLREILRREGIATLPSVDLVVRTKRVAYSAPMQSLRAELLESVRRIP